MVAYLYCMINKNPEILAFKLKIRKAKQLTTGFYLYLRPNGLILPPRILRLRLSLRPVFSHLIFFSSPRIKGVCPHTAWPLWLTSAAGGIKGVCHPPLPHLFNYNRDVYVLDSVTLLFGCVVLVGRERFLLCFSLFYLIGLPVGIKIAFHQHSTGYL